MNCSNKPREIEDNKYRYCVHKDELVLAIGEPISKQDAYKKTNSAYPRVISNLGMMDGNDNYSKFFQLLHAHINHHALDYRSKSMITDFIQQKFESEDDIEFKTFMKDIKPKLYTYIPMGYAQTLGWASDRSGDTMVTVMVGGMRTVMNGDFPITTGQLIQWYWPFELVFFKQDGTRSEWKDITKIDHTIGPINTHTILAAFDKEKANINASKKASETSRQQMFERSYGQPSGTPKVVPRIKPYFKDYDYPRIADEERVFAVAMSSARPHEMVDIKICRQSL
jgi:hypothetical protein